MWRRIVGFIVQSVEFVSSDSAKKICEIFHFNRSDVFFFQSQMSECLQNRMAQLYTWKEVYIAGLSSHILVIDYPHPSKLFKSLGAIPVTAQVNSSSSLCLA